MATSGLTNGINKASSAEGINHTTTVEGIVHTVMNLLTWIVGVAAIIMLIVGGIKLITSAGDEKRLTSAKHTIMYALIGLAVAILAWTLANFVIVNL